MKASNIKHFKLTVCYNGSPFNGWQSQANHNGIQDYLERALGILLRVPIRIQGASRTDAGVHAEGQIACFSSAPNSLLDDTRKFLDALNALIPPQVFVTSLQTVSQEFHPIADCIGKVYRYRLWMGKKPNPFVSGYCWPIHQNTSFQTIHKNLEKLVGTHDFRAFCAADSSAKSTIRTVFEARIEIKNPIVEIWISGNGFLKQMVRTIVGTLIDIERDRARSQDILEILNGHDRKLAGRTAPAQGLALVKIFYDQLIPISELIDQAKESYNVNVMI